MERNEMEDWLNKWINNYQCDSSSSWDLKAKKPLAAAKVTVVANEADPGYYSADFFLRPHIQLEGLTAALHLVSRLPVLGGK
jgi:type VI secretion system protein ImpC